jgi:hypothetical protein
MLVCQAGAGNYAKESRVGFPLHVFGDGRGFAGSGARPKSNSNTETDVSFGTYFIFAFRFCGISRHRSVHKARSLSLHSLRLKCRHTGSPSRFEVQHSLVRVLRCRFRQSLWTGKTITLDAPPPSLHKCCILCVSIQCLEFRRSFHWGCNWGMGMCV